MDENLKPAIKSVHTISLSAQSLYNSQSFSGVVHARNEIPIAFQVGGRIRERNVDAGQRVKAGEILFSLETQELEQNLLAARALSTSADAELDVALADVERYRDLYQKNTVSKQVLERAELSERAARAKHESLSANLKQAEISIRHGVVRAPAPGILMDVSGSVGQVVAAGQAIAMLGDDREWEVEVFLPDGFAPPPWATTHVGEREETLSLRELAGAADVNSRTWRARYRIEKEDSLKLGMLLSVTMQATQAGGEIFAVPLAAIDERGDGPHVWKVVDNKAKRTPISLIGMGAREARIAGQNIKPGDHIIALGTHLLESGMVVREIAP